MSKGKGNYLRVVIEALPIVKARTPVEVNGRKGKAHFCYEGRLLVEFEDGSCERPDPKDILIRA